MLIGLTGGIACGKSTVAQLLTDRGAAVVDADRVAREVVAPGSAGLAALAQAFGAEVLDPRGHLDRARLATLVFGDAAARRRLEAITHPLIAQESMRQLAAAAATGAPLVVYDAALLFESGRAEHFRPVLVVSARPEVQRARLMARDGLTAAEADARINAQMPVADKAARADHVIENSGDRAQTAAQVAALWAQWVHP
ncbi:MAG: dephospho-CoA kinase [Myxococcales bacterium]|nr:dephospho-CoA kinase [Myxococcales bacterium]MCB9526478.1 dephospho-CoA kinase [Myxococcales bacterium]